MRTLSMSPTLLAGLGNGVQVDQAINFGRIGPAAGDAAFLPRLCALSTSTCIVWPTRCCRRDGDFLGHGHEARAALFAHGLK